MLKKILGVLAALLAVFVIVVATRPATFEMKRSLVINAPPEVVFAQVHDFKSWGGWSPWEKLDPTMKRTWGSSTAGIGATYAWESDKVGSGNMKITDEKPNEHVGIELEFTAPFAAKNRAEFDFVKTGEGTTATWAMSGGLNFGSKAMSLFKSMDAMVGPDFEKGLASMKTLAEADAAKRAADAKAAAEAAAAAPPAPAEAPADAGAP
jgi:hypothetical protein